MPKCEVIAIPESMNTLEIPFKNLMNENYAKDISDKIRSSHVIRKQNGDYIGVIAPYGYIKDPKDCHKLLIDEEVAPYIKKIFDLALKGNSRQDIIKELNRLNISTPSMYFKLKYNLKNKRVAYEWNLNAIDRIIKNETYIGNLVQGKTKRVSHKIHNIVRRPEEEWIRAKKTHKPIIDEKTFKIVNDIFYLRGNLVNNKGKLHTYSGHLKCADCGANLTISRKDKDGAIRYYCSSYKNKKICSRHYISEKHLNNLVLTTFNKYINLLCNIEEKVNEVLIGTKLKYNEEINRIKKIDINKEINKYQVLVDELLKDYEADLINKEELENYNRLYLGKINKLRIELQEIESSKSSFINEDWIKKFKDKKEVDVIDRNIVIEFIDNIYVYEDGNIKIVFKNNDEYLETIKFLKSHNCVV